MNLKPIALIFAVVLAGTAVLGIPMLQSEPDRSPVQADYDPPEEQPAADHLPYARTVESTSILYNITNHSPTPQTIKLVLSRAEKLPAFFHVGAELFHNDGNWTNLFAGKWVGYTGGAGRGVVAVHSDPISFEGPVVEIPLPSLGRAESYAIDGHTHIEPGSHRLFITVQNVEMELLIKTDREENVTIDVVEEDPDMDRMLWAHVPGHWDEVDLEFYGAFGLAGAIDASTTVKMKHSYRSVRMMASGDYAEIHVTDEEGGTCSATSTDWPPRRSLHFKPEKGVVNIEAMNVAAFSIAVVLAHVQDIPVEWEGFREWCW